MPIYQYRCLTCEKEFEILHKMSQVAPPHGPQCSRSDCHLDKQLSAPAIAVKSTNPFKTPAHQHHLLENQCQSEEKKVPSGPSCTAGGCALHKH